MCGFRALSCSKCCVPYVGWVAVPCVVPSVVFHLSCGLSWPELFQVLWSICFVGYRTLSLGYRSLSCSKCCISYIVSVPVLRVALSVEFHTSFRFPCRVLFLMLCSTRRVCSRAPYCFRWRMQRSLCPRCHNCWTKREIVRALLLALLKVESQCYPTTS